MYKKIEERRIYHNTELWKTQNREDLERNKRQNYKTL